MCPPISMRVLLSACLLLIFSNMSYAVEQGQTPASPCSYAVYGNSHYTKYSVADFMTEPHASDVRWLCYGGKLLLQTRASSNGGNYVWSLDNIRYEFLKEGKKFAKQNGHTIMLRMVVQEYTSVDADNRYWLIDFREKEPLVVGPMCEHDASQNFNVIWNDQSVIVVLDGGENIWDKGERKPVENGGQTVDLNGKQVPMLNKDGKDHNKDETIYPACLYDYKKKQAIDAYIME
jgi:hypothetical protein